MEEKYDLSTYKYDIPKNLIAQKPLLSRDSSRLLVLDRQTGGIEHEKFFNIHNFLNPGDCIVINDTKVFPARLYGEKYGTRAQVEMLLLEKKSEFEWEVMIRNSRRIRLGDTMLFPEGIQAGVLEKDGKISRVKLNFSEDVLKTKLWKSGFMPLPPYIKQNILNKMHKKRYQTVYAQKEGAVAAPTAGLHFTDRVFAKLKSKGIKIVKITLHVGIGTFKPVVAHDIREHRMHSEYFEISGEASEVINSTISSKARVIACGTTSLRCLESAVSGGKIMPKSGYTGIFIYPGYEFKVTDALITNFHQPESTLFMLVCAFAGIDRIKSAYSEAIRKKYRFFSYGDAMLIK